MAIFSRIIFETVKWRARRGLSGGEPLLIGICDGMDMFLCSEIMCREK